MAEPTKPANSSEQGMPTSITPSEQVAGAEAEAKTGIVTPEIQALIDEQIATATAKVKSDVSSEMGKKLSEAKRDQYRIQQLAEDNDARARALEARVQALTKHSEDLVNTYVAPDDQPRVRRETNVQQELAETQVLRQQLAIAQQKAFITKTLAENGIPEDHPDFAGRVFGSAGEFNATLALVKVKAETATQLNEFRAQLAALQNAGKPTEADKKAAEKAALTTAAQEGAGVGLVRGTPRSGGTDWTKVDSETFQKEYKRKKAESGYPQD